MTVESGTWRAVFGGGKHGNTVLTGPGMACLVTKTMTLATSLVEQARANSCKPGHHLSGGGSSGKNMETGMVEPLAEWGVCLDDGFKGAFLRMPLKPWDA